MFKATIAILYIFILLGSCLGAALLGIWMIWYSVDGIYYGFTKAPSSDRAGDLFGAGLLGLIGLLLLVFVVRWLVYLYRFSVGLRRKK